MYQEIVCQDYTELRTQPYHEYLTYQEVIDALSQHVAILDPEGRIVATNQAWRRFAGENRARVPFDMLGMNYLNICERSGGPHAMPAYEAAEGIRAVAVHQVPEFTQIYECHSPVAERWFRMKVSRMSGPASNLLMIYHEDCTEVVKAQINVKAREAELKEIRQSFNEMGITLRVLLKEQEKKNNEVEEKIEANVKELVLPFLKKVRRGHLTADQLSWLELAEAYLENIVSPLAHRLFSHYRGLTSTEIRVAEFIKDGYANKEIASIMGISVRTVEFHRAHLRHKLGLKSRRDNLRAYLLAYSR
ncbi:MAG: helix-turn-helix transcriptional regulator [Deltaproteobacteria bacterium]|nr:helix-turn-helix transcriptional regulator [Deltaproteobacteria bacterium]